MEGLREQPDKVRLEDSGLFLEPADVFHDLLNVIRLHGVDLRHVAELPMVRFDAVGGGAQEGRIAMVIGLIDFMHERRTLLGSDASRAVTGRAIGGELLFSVAQLYRSRTGRSLRRGRLGLAACRRGTEQERDETNSKHL